MFLKSVTELAADFPDVRDAMLRDPRDWLSGLAAEAGDDGDRLVVHVGLEVAGQQVGGPARLEVGEPVTGERVVMLPLSLRPRDHARLFPALEGSLDAAWLGPGRTYLALSVTYEPPLGLVGRTVDRALLHRVAETAAQRFLVAVAHELADRAERPGSAGPSRQARATP
ncbi:MAG TPA: hypothetical protein VE953_22840 [Terriglobales bacterium]|nr:hypothetical protein [Terriglobales bacterium]